MYCGSDRVQKQLTLNNSYFYSDVGIYVRTSAYILTLLIIKCQKVVLGWFLCLVFAPLSGENFRRVVVVWEGGVQAASRRTFVVLRSSCVPVVVNAARRAVASWLSRSRKGADAFQTKGKPMSRRALEGRLVVELSLLWTVFEHTGCELFSQCCTMISSSSLCKCLLPRPRAPVGCRCT